MHTPYRGRCHTKKQSNCKNKISSAERKIRAALKKLEKLFPHYKNALPFYAKFPAKPNLSPPGSFGRGLGMRSISITKKRIAV